MKKWKEILGWREEQFKELRFAGFSFLRQGQYAKALTFFEALVTIEPESTYDVQTLGALYLQLGRHEEAITIFDQALELDSEHEPTLLNKAKALFMVHQNKQALQIVRALQISRDSSIANDAKALLASYH